MKNEKSRKIPVYTIFRLCERDRIRTYDRLLRREVLYPAELRARSIKIKKTEHIHVRSFVGVAGFEPATSCSQSRRDNRATLHPEVFLTSFEFKFNKLN